MDAEVAEEEKLAVEKLSKVEKESYELGESFFSFHGEILQRVEQRVMKLPRVDLPTVFVTYWSIGFAATFVIPWIMVHTILSHEFIIET